MRINCVPVGELCDQHLKAELNSINYVINSLIQGKMKFEYADRPDEYHCGIGHLKFFTNKLRFLLVRYTDIGKELTKRGVRHQDPLIDWELVVRRFFRYWNDWHADNRAKRFNRHELDKCMPNKATWTEYVQLS